MFSAATVNNKQLQSIGGPGNRARPRRTPDNQDVPLSPAGLKGPAAGTRPIEQLLDRYSSRERDRVVERTTAKHQLSGSERAQLLDALTDVENAKSKEYWEKRATAETLGVVGRVVLATGVTVAAGLTAPGSALFPAAMSSLTNVTASLAVIYKRLAHALFGRAALEVSRIDEQRREHGELAPAPKKKKLHQRVADWFARRVIEKYTTKNQLSPEQRALVERSVNDAAVAKTTELFEKRLGLELAAITGTSAISAALGLCFGFIAAPGVAVLALSAAFGSLISIGLSARKLHSNLEGEAYAAVEQLAKDAPADSLLAVNAAKDRARERKALKTADEVAAKYAARYELDPEQHAELESLLEDLAYLKEKELWEKRLLPTLFAPLTRGGSVAVSASMLGLVGPPAVTALMIGALAESAVSGLLLYKKLDQALQGAAYAYVLSTAAANTRG